MDKKICDTCNYSLPYGKNYVNCNKIGKIVKKTFSCKFYRKNDEISETKVNT